MGHKVHPLSFRLGYTRMWSSRWFAKKKAYAQWLKEDIEVRAWLTRELRSAAVSKIEIERPGEKLRVTIHTARPGVIIGRRGAEIDRLREVLHERTQREVAVDIREVKVPSTEPQLIAQNIAFQLEKRIAFRRAMKKAIQMAREHGAKGIKVSCDGRLAGAELSRREGYLDGKVPLGTFRADIEYGFAEALTTYGIIGVKVWVYKGDVFAAPGAGTPRAEEQVSAGAGVSTPQPSVDAVSQGAV